MMKAHQNGNEELGQQLSKMHMKHRQSSCNEDGICGSVMYSVVRAAASSKKSKSVRKEKASCQHLSKSFASRTEGSR